jgi:Protein of unknown function (DUF3122)
MLSQIWQICLHFFLINSLAVFFFFSSTIVCLPASAVLRQHHEAPGVLRYHSQFSVKDKQGISWQVVLFSETGERNEFNLRLVGFPGLAEFEHPQPLEILTSQGKLLVAKDVFAESAPAPNVGQYDLSDILPQLPQKGTLKLSVPLKGNKDLSLKVPESILIEWHWLEEEI